MPCKASKARKLLKHNQAKVVRTEPFIIQLLYGSSGFKQDITIGIDPGSKYIGISATTEKQELYSSIVELRQDIVKNLSQRRANRRSRRGRKTRYRESRFLNRVSSKRKGWLAPSIENKIQTHLKIIKEVYKLLPIKNIIVEINNFDIKMIKEIETGCKDNQLDFRNVREYVLWRDNHTCQHCKGKSGDPVLRIHHIESRQTGGNSPGNLITLCNTCHNNYHSGKIELNIKRQNSYRDAFFMNVLKDVLLEKLKLLYNNISITYGYLTKDTRISLGLPKNHHIDAYCISGNINAKRLDYHFYQQQVRKTNRQIHKMKILKGGSKKPNQSPKYVFGFQLFDKVKYDGKLYYIFGRRMRGEFDIRDLSGNKVKGGSISYKKLQLIERRKSLLIERRDDKI